MKEILAKLNEAIALAEQADELGVRSDQVGIDYYLTYTNDALRAAIETERTRRADEAEQAAKAARAGDLLAGAGMTLEVPEDFDMDALMGGQLPTATPAEQNFGPGDAGPQFLDAAWDDEEETSLVDEILASYENGPKITATLTAEGGLDEHVVAGALTQVGRKMAEMLAAAGKGDTTVEMAQEIAPLWAEMAEDIEIIEDTAATCTVPSVGIGGNLTVTSYGIDITVTFDGSDLAEQAAAMLADAGIEAPAEGTAYVHVRRVDGTELSDADADTVLGKLLTDLTTFTGFAGGPATGITVPVVAEDELFETEVDDDGDEYTVRRYHQVEAGTRSYAMVADGTLTAILRAGMAPSVDTVAGVGQVEALLTTLPPAVVAQNIS